MDTISVPLLAKGLASLPFAGVIEATSQAVRDRSRPGGGATSAAWPLVTLVTEKGGEACFLMIVKLVCV